MEDELIEAYGLIHGAQRIMDYFDANKCNSLKINKTDIVQIKYLLHTVAYPLYKEIEKILANK